ncbi:N4-gp56 family major capsid protein [Undibacterium sp.]|uniref:N4-gp56 family major capsid protein n=1 Tax=Undibacterium sp. TaxID=1914977 RepID=UPI00374D468A
MQNYNTVPSRNLIRAERDMLKHAEPIKVLSSFGKQIEQPKNATDTVVFRRALPIDANTYNAPSSVDPSQYMMQEGVTPSARTIQYQDVTAVLQQYGVLMKLSSKTESLYEDDVPSDMTQLVGEHMGSLEELINYGVVKGGTSVVYANGSTRAGVNTPISLNRLRQCARQLEMGHAKLVTNKLAAGANFGTSAISPAYLVFISTDLEADVRNLPGFVPTYEYASGQVVHEREVGACERFRFISSPYFKPFLSAGASVGTGTFLVNGGTGAGNADVYPILIVAQDAYAQVALKGMGSAHPIYLPAKTITHANPMGQFGYVGASFWKTAVRLNESWMVRLEVAASAL